VGIYVSCAPLPITTNEGVGKFKIQTFPINP